MPMVCLTVCLIIIVSLGVSQAAEVRDIISFPYSGPLGRDMGYAYGRAWVPTTRGNLIAVGPSPGDLRWYSLRDGLASERPERVVRDERGLLWFSSSYSGSGIRSNVCLFDGISCSSYEPDDRQPVMGLAAGPDGSVWFLTYRSLFCWDGGTPEEWTGFDRGTASSELCVDAEGHVWFVSPHSLVEFDGAEFNLYELPERYGVPYAGDMLADRGGAIWWTIYQGEDRPKGLACYDHGDWRLYSNEDLGSIHIWSLAEDPGGLLLVGTDKGAFMYDGERWTHFGVEAGLPFEQVRDIVVDPEGNLWVWCTPDPQRSYGALAKFDGEQMRTFELKSHPVTAHGHPKTVDDEGRVWLASENGFSSFLSGDWESIHIEPPPQYSEPVRVSDDGTIWWFGQESGSSASDWGFWRYTDGTAQFYDDEDGLYIDRCWDLEIDSEGTVWAVGSGAGGLYSRQYVSRYDGSRWESWDELNVSDPWLYDLNDLAIDLDDSVWCAVGYIEWERILGGWIYHWSPSTLEMYWPPDTGPWGPRLGAAAVGPDGTKWFLKLWQDPNGVFGGTGIFRYDGANWVWKRYRDFFLSGSIDPPLYVDNFANVWMSFTAGDPDPGKGLLCYHPETDTFTRYTVADGLGSPYVGLVLMDADENVWVDGSGAVSILLADGNLELGAKTDETHYSPEETMTASMSWLYNGPSPPADLYAAIQVQNGQIFYVAPQEAEPPFPIFYAAFDGSTEFLQPGPDYDGPGSIPNTPDMKDLAPPPVPLPDPTGLALFAYPVPYCANVPLPAYSAIDNLVLLSTTLPGNAPAGTYTFHLGITAPSSISNLYRTASCTFEVTDE